ncbi:hypothetical protein AD945_03730 [Gluconobacter albidus]|uniref:Uncharacterized protein n=1 Tax=Gluconobacter albidus TaxID=318683 RepID=A0A149TLI8_9PROT|nr:hypothetical protein AD945_03730 [Gluconobacter albidus]
MNAKQIIIVEACCFVALGSLILVAYATYRHFFGPKQADRWQIVRAGITELASSMCMKSAGFSQFYDQIT